MSTTPAQPPPDPIALVRDLTSDQVRARLDALDAERKALMSLLRSILARERAAMRRGGTVPPSAEEAARAS
jgi:hypothetical protein